MVTAEKSRIDCRHIDVLDGIRAVSVIIVLIFHFWQQTWIFPVIKTPWLAFVGITKIDFSNFATVGYLFVDMMVLISGFLLFLPLMRSIILGEEMSTHILQLRWMLCCGRLQSRFGFMFFFRSLPNSSRDRGTKTGRVSPPHTESSSFLPFLT